MWVSHFPLFSVGTGVLCPLEVLLNARQSTFSFSKCGIPHFRERERERERKRLTELIFGDSLFYFEDFGSNTPLCVCVCVCVCVFFLTKQNKKCWN